ncbi:MAG: ATP-dependent DNA helicase, partial [Polyangiaceae bacterium]
MIEQLLGPQGPFATGLPSYEERPGQVAMAQGVERALDEDGILLCEAGTGTGKTLAYLVPAILSGRRIVVSTASKALQEQIFFKDIPLVERALKRSAEALLVKGIGNYLCRRRLDELSRGLVAPSDAVRRALPIAERWADTTHSGDLAELTMLPEAHPIRRELHSSSETRIGSGCAFFERCHITRLRRESEQAKLLVVNHHLFFADLALKSNDRGGGVLPDYDAVILDEAHRIEDIATQFWGVEVSSVRVDKLLRDARLAYGQSSDEGRLCGRIEALADALLGGVNLALGASTEQRVRLPDDTWTGKLLENYHAFDDTLAALEGDLATRSADEAISPSLVKRARSLRDDLNLIVETDNTRICFLERAAGRIKLASSPVDVGELLRERLFARGDPTVLTSASLTTGGKYDFMRDRLGLDARLDTPVEEMSVGTCLRHEEQALLYLPRDLPAVDSPDFIDEAAARIATLVRLTPGGTFVLCTSLRAMKGLSAALRPQLDTPVFVQGELPKTALLEAFKGTEDATLVASMSFWEGVDAPGQALRLVVIDRIPFPVPSDPLVVARARGVEARGKSAFMHYHLPQAALTLKQGFGRLL